MCCWQFLSTNYAKKFNTRFLMQCNFYVNWKIKFHGSMTEPFPSLLQRDVRCVNSLQAHHYHALFQNLLFLWKNQDLEPAKSQREKRSFNEHVTRNKKEAGFELGKINKPNQGFSNCFGPKIRSLNLLAENWTNTTLINLKTEPIRWSSLFSFDQASICQIKFEIE